MCRNTHIRQQHTPSHSVRVGVKYARCVLEVSDNSSKTHAVLFGWTLCSAASHLFPCTSLPSHFFMRAAAKLYSYFSFFFYFFSHSGWDCRACTVSELPLAAQSRSPPAFSPWGRILKGSAVRSLLCSCHQETKQRALCNTHMLLLGILLLLISL